MSIFKPDRFLKHYRDLDLDVLKEEGVSHIFMDIDNTLAPYYEKTADKEARDFIHKLQNAGFVIVLVSNNKQERVKTFADSLKLPYRYFALKPLPFTYRSLLKKYGIKKSRAICIGDQLLTDVLGAHFAGIRVFLTKPLVDKDSFSTRINRHIEKLIMRNWQ